MMLAHCGHHLSTCLAKHRLRSLLCSSALACKELADQRAKTCLRRKNWATLHHTAQIVQEKTKGISLCSAKGQAVQMRAVATVHALSYRSSHAGAPGPERTVMAAGLEQQNF